MAMSAQTGCVVGSVVAACLGAGVVSDPAKPVQKKSVTPKVRAHHVKTVHDFTRVGGKLVVGVESIGGKPVRHVVYPAGKSYTVEHDIVRRGSKVWVHHVVRGPLGNVVIGSVVRHVTAD
ncbi:MAG TPA: hypothetical protein VNA68_02190 [Candidatus Dormibacteraeota bacterium]|nr:hypothetical protein [Candidatus Dormibacteraeota bacterium]